MTPAIVPGFNAPIDLRVWDVAEWALRDAVTYTALDGRCIEIPAWFIHDGASIPRPARALYGTDDELRGPALLHDWLYCSQLLPRDEADALFLEAMARAGSGWVKRRSIHAAVRAGGWYRWNQCAGGVKREDFAWAYMTAEQSAPWLGALSA